MKSVGAFAPSSKYLVKKMLDPVDFSRNLKILELGPGTGVITKQILHQLNDNSKLISMELNDEFYELLKPLESKNFELIHGSAETVHDIFEENSFDYIISGLPLAIFKKVCIQNIVKGCNQTLKPNGKFIQFQYSLTSKRILQRNFSHVSISVAAVNLPPAVIYTCKK